MNIFFWGQLFTFFSYLIFWLSRFLKEKKNMLLLDNICRFLAIISFIFLKTYDGIKNTIYVIIRNLLGQVTNEKSKKIKLITFFTMFIVLILMYYINFQGISTVCIAICGILNLYGTIMCNEQGIRIFGMIGSIFYTGFMIFTGNIIGALCEIICFFMMLMSYIKYKKNNAVIFDLDGTLWEVIDSTLYSVNEIANKYDLGEVKRETICKVFGLNKEESAKLYFPFLELTESVKLMDEIAVINIKNLKQNGGNIYPHLKEVLTELKNQYKLFIVSNTAEMDYIEAFLTSSGTKNFFNDYIASSKLKIYKGDAIKKIIKDNNIKKAIYIGDTIKDYEAANYAEIPFIQAKYGFGEDLNTKYAVNNLEELPEKIKNIFEK